MCCCKAGASSLNRWQLKTSGMNAFRWGCPHLLLFPTAGHWTALEVVPAMTTGVWLRGVGGLAACFILPFDGKGGHALLIPQWAHGAPGAGVLPIWRS